MNRHSAAVAEILRERDAVDLETERLRWQLRRLIPDVIRRTAADRVERLKADEAFRRAGRQQHERALQEIEKEETATRTLAAGVGRRALHLTVRQFEQNLAGLLDRITHDAELTLPDSLDRLDPAGMLAFHLLKEQRRPRFEQMAPADLARTLRAALPAGDASARIDLELIEERVDRGGLAKNEADLSAAHELTELIAGLREARIPTDLIGAEASIAAATTVLANSDMLAVPTVDAERDPNARAASDREQEAFAAERAAGGAQ